MHVERDPTGGGRGGLAFTGFDEAAMLLIAATVLLFGVAVHRAGRVRRRH